MTRPAPRHRPTLGQATVRCTALAVLPQAAAPPGVRRRGSLPEKTQVRGSGEPLGSGGRSADRIDEAFGAEGAPRGTRVPDTE